MAVRAQHRLAIGLPIVFLALWLSACSQQPAAIAELQGSTMGTGYSIKLSPAPDRALLEQLREAIATRLEDVNALMSTYRNDSVLSRFNASSSTAWQAVPRPLVELTDEAAQISARSNGAYDVTVGPLVNLWGFGRDGRRNDRPGQDEIAALLPRVGYHKLDTRLNPSALRKTAGALEVDLSSIAKGWGVDEIARLLEQEGLNNYLVEIGGELRAAGTKASGEPWRIAVERPVPGHREIQRIVELSDIAMATSGDYRNFFEQDGQRHSHTIDPATGQPFRHRLASVTVFAETCALADGWATALMALGDERGPVVADSNDIKALFIVREDHGLSERVSRALADDLPWQE
jgi:thiamine biosynthesis lipoprotein